MHKLPSILKDCYQYFRTILGLYILDSHLASVFHHETLLRHASSELAEAVSDGAFNASTAEEWNRMLKKSPQRLTRLKSMYTIIWGSSIESSTPEELDYHQSRFTAYFALQSISAQVSEFRSQYLLDYGSSEFEKLCNGLICWYKVYESPINANNSHDHLGLIILWHTIFMALFANFNKLERALGRDGSNVPIEDDLEYAVSWARSISADRCILHAQKVQALLIQMRLNTHPAIHIPHCAFLAGIACYSAINFQRHPFSIPGPNTPRAPSEFPEFDVEGRWTNDHVKTEAPVLFQNAAGEQLVRTIGMPREVWHVGADVFRQCVDVLERMGRWGNAKRYGVTLSALINPELEKWMLG